MDWWAWLFVALVIVFLLCVIYMTAMAGREPIDD